MEKRLVVSFSDGEDILSGLRDAAREHDVDFARFHSADGCLKDFQIISDSYDDLSTVPEDHVIDKISGRVLKGRDGHSVKVHFTLIKKSAGKTLPISGELKKGVASGDVTLVLTLSDMKGIIH